MNHRCNKPPLYHRENGLTLIEILIALALGVLITAGTLGIFTESRKVYRLQESLSRLQENGRFAAEFVTRDLRMAGYTGCLSQRSANTMVNTLNNGTDFLYNFAIPIQGFEAVSVSAWDPTLHSTITSVTTPPIGGTDVLSVRSVTRTLPITPPFMSNTSASLQITPGSPVAQFDIVIVSDCEGSAIMQISNSNPGTSGTIVHNTGVGTPGNATNNLGKIFRDDAQFLFPQVKTLFIAAGASGRPTLWELVNSRPLGADNPRELVEGVEDMQVLYGEDTDSDETVDVYVTADNVSAWDNVVAIRVSLLLQTLEDNLAMQAQRYVYNGATITPSDRRLRRVFTTTVGIRNRIP